MSQLTDFVENLQPHQKRVVEEQQELLVKTTKLGMFFSSPQFRLLDAAEQERLNRQWQLMQQYGLVLDERIAAFQ